MNGYFTVKNEAEYSFTEKKSEFIGFCAPVGGEAEALAFIAGIKKKHSAAKHNVYAYVLREGFTQRFSDDGEPHGTAGMPVLDVIRKAGLTDTAIVVTRYFGGILLGTGGLLRAYTAAATGALQAAGRIEYGAFAVIRLCAGYADYQKLMPILNAFGARIEKNDFSETVELVFSVKEEAAETLASGISEATGGRIKPERIGTRPDII